jgi:hypothetical protein
LQRPPYIQKATDPIFLRPKFDVRHPSLKVEKLRSWNWCHTFNPYFFGVFSSSTPTNLCLAHLFCFRQFFLNLTKKKIVITFFVLFNGPAGKNNTLFFIFFLFLKCLFLSNHSTADLTIKIDPLITILENFYTP